MLTSFITIHSTKKLAAKFPKAFFTAQPEQVGNVVYLNTPASKNPLGHWHANLLLLQRCQCVLMVHDETRFPLFIPNLRKDDFARFEFYFRDVLMNTLLKLDASEQQMENASRLLESLRFDTVCNKSVLGTMIQMTGDVKYLL